MNWDYVYYDGPTCADHSELQIAEDQLTREMEEEGDLEKIAVELVQPLACERKPGFNICVDFFIANRRSFVFGGNDRSYDPEAGIKQSKVQFYYNTETGAKAAMVNDTYILLGSHYVLPRNSSDELFKIDEDYIVEHSGDTTSIKMVGRNNYCVSRSGCPSIDAKIWLIPNAGQPDGYETYWKRDAYPSMQILKSTDNGESWGVSLARDPENGLGPWVAWTALIGKRKQSIRMPPGCNLQ